MVDIEDIEDMLSSDFFIENVENKIKIQDDIEDNNDNKIINKCNNIVLKQIKSIEEIKFLPKKDEQIRLVTTRAFNSLSIIQYIIKKEEIKECYLGIYSVSQRTILYLEAILDKYNDVNFTFLISSWQNKELNKKNILIKTIGEKYSNLKIIYACSHIKLIAIKTENNFYIVEGSGNLSGGSRIESYLIDNNKKIYDFHAKWIGEIEENSLYKELKIIDF